MWKLSDISCKATIPTYEALEAVCAIGSKSSFAKCLASLLQKRAKKKSGPPLQFITVGERGVVRIWNSDGCVRTYIRLYIHENTLSFYLFTILTLCFF